MYVRHSIGEAWGVGVLVERTRDQRTYLFADGGLRSFKEAFCQRYIVPAEPPASEEERERLSRGLSTRGLATPRAIHLELEAQIHARPDDPAPSLVYADWLQLREDPRGKLIAIQHQLAMEPADPALRDAERSLLAAQGVYLLPESLHALLRLPRRRGDDPRARCEVEWRRGFLASARLARRPMTAAAAAATVQEMPGLVDELLGHPSAHFLSRLVIGPLGTPDEYNYIDVVEAIARRGHARLEELVIGDFGPEMELAFSRAGNVAPLLAAAPRLRRLALRAGSLRFESALEHAELRELSVVVATISEGNLRRLLEARLPALESFELACPGVDLTVEELARMLRGTSMPRLRRLALRGTAGTLRVIEEILGSPLMPQLEVLELDGGDLDDRAAESLVTVRAPRLRHLKRLDVSGNAMSEAAAQQLSQLCGSVQAAPRPRRAVAIEDVVARAPDARSMTAARAIARPECWMTLGRDRDRVWGEYEGGDNYYVWARLDERGAGCNCPSPKDPCKHALALLLIAASPHAFEQRPIPEAFLRRSGQARPRYGAQAG
jgi:uncharacterized protein (TIGR02996 family)